MARLPASLHFCDQPVLVAKGRYIGNEINLCIWLVSNDMNVNTLDCRHLPQQKAQSVCGLKLGFHWIMRFHHILKITRLVKSSRQFHQNHYFQQTLKYND